MQNAEPTSLLCNSVISLQSNVGWIGTYNGVQKENVVSNFCTPVYKDVDVHTAHGRQSNAIDLVIATVSSVYFDKG